MCLKSIYSSIIFIRKADNKADETSSDDDGDDSFYEEESDSSLSDDLNSIESSDSVVYDKHKNVEKAGNPALKQYLISKQHENHLNLKHFGKPSRCMYGNYRNKSKTLTANNLKDQNREMGAVYGIEDRRFEIFLPHNK